MEVTPEVFAWLVSLRLLSPESAPISFPTKRLLPPSTTLSLEHASFFRLLFQRTLSPVFIDPFPDLSVIADSPNPAGKLANWSFVFDVCTNLSIRLPEERRMLILAGDHASIAVLLGDIKIAIALAKSGKGKRPKVAQDGALFIESVNEKRPIEESESCLEFLLLSFCQCFGVKTKQAAGLLTQGNKYLAQIIGKGLKTDFVPIRSWYRRLKSCASHLTALILKESQSGSLALVLSAFRPGFLSKDEGVVLDCAALFLALVPQLTLNSDQCWDWFTAQPGGIDACYNAIQRLGGSVLHAVAGVLHEAGRFNYKDMLALHIRAQSTSVIEYLQVLSDLIPSLVGLPQAVERLTEESVLPELVEVALRESDSDGKRSTSSRSAALTLLSILWRYIPAYFEEHEEVVNSLLAMMKKACRDKSLLLSCHSAGHLFSLLIKLYAGRSQYAPLIFKSLTFLMIETFESVDFKEFVMSNFVIMLGEIQSLPISTMVEPMIKQLNLMQEVEMNCGDFDFFVAIARHPRLALEHAIMLSDICGKQYLAQIHLARAACVPLLLLAKRFLSTEVMREFIFRFTKLSLGVVTQSEKERRMLPKKKPLYNNKPVVIGTPISPDELVGELAKTHQNRLILNFVSRIIGLDNVEINTRIKELLVASITELHRTKFDYHKGMMKVLGLLGNATELVGTRDATIELAAIKPRKRPRFEVLAEPTVKLSQPNSSQLRITQPYSAADFDPKRPSARRSPSLKKSIWPKSYLSHGDSPALSYSQFDSPSFDVVKIREMDYSEDELDNVRAAMKMFSRVTKHLFRNYCGSSYARSSLDQDTFNQQETKKTHIREAEMFKMLKDNGVTNSFILKEQFSSLLKSYCVKNRTVESTAVDFTQFLELIVQVALFVFSRPTRDLSHLPPSVSVLSFFDLIQSHWKALEKPLTLFDPPYLLHGDREAVLQLNRQLARNPAMDLPEGFKRTTNKEIELRFDLAEETGVKESYRVALATINDVLWEAVEVRLLEPRVVVRTVVRVEAAGAMGASHSVGEIKQAPTAIHRNPGLKFEVAKLQRKYSKLGLMEIAKLIDDLLTSVETEAAAHMRRSSTGRIHNRALVLREQKEKQESQARSLAEQKRRQRQEELEGLLAKANETKRKQERRDRHKKRKADKARGELEERVRERRRKELEARAAEMAEWAVKRQAEEQEKRKAEYDKQLATEAAKKARRLKYEKVIKSRLEQLIKQKAEARRLELSRAEAEAKQNTSKRELEKRKAGELLELERKRRESEQRMKRDFSSLSTNTEIAAVLDEYRKSLEVVFDFYVRVGTRDPRAATVLQWPGLNKLCLQFFVLPEIVSTEELTILYRMYTKEKSVSEPGIVIGMEKGEFFDCIIRIAALGQNQLRNKPGEEYKFELADCNALTVKALLRYMEVPTDSKRVIDLLKLLSSQPPVHPRERKRISRGKFHSDRLSHLEEALIAENTRKT